MTTSVEDKVEIPSVESEIPHFKIAADVVFRLGQELITDVMQALVELVKNSYDADANRVYVTIKTPNPEAPPDSAEALGEIRVEDNGHGMDDVAFRKGWLTIAKSNKKAMKDAGKTTKKGRTPIGDKGLGRLGVQRLGHDLEIISRVADTTAHELRLALSWRAFMDVALLSDVPVKLEKQAHTGLRPGTCITIRDLKDPEQWRGDEAKTKLQNSLVELISPYSKAEDFLVDVKLNGEALPLVKIAASVRNQAVARYKLDFDGSKLTVTGQYRLNFVGRAQDKEGGQCLKELMEKDGGLAFFNYLKDKRGCPPRLEFQASSKWFLTFRKEIPRNDLGGIKLIKAEQSRAGVANPGSFHGEVDYLFLDEMDQNIWTNKGEFRKLVKSYAGIRVYRDGFGIRVDKDWLKLGHQATSGGSLYGLRQMNTLGFIAISARENSVLLETTSREGFQKTPHYLNFYELLQQFVDLSNRTQTFLRRNALKFLAGSNARGAGLEPDGSTATAAQLLHKNATSIDRRGEKLTQIATNTKQQLIKAKASIKKVTSDDDSFPLLHQDKIAKVNNIIAGLESTTDQLSDALEDKSESNSAKAQQILDVVLEREKRLKEEMSMFYETMNLGVIAEMLSHEIANIADRIAGRAWALSRYLSKEEIKDFQILLFVQHTKATIAALRKQLSHLEPSLRYVREKRAVLAIRHKLEALRDFHKDKYERSQITLLIKGSAEFNIQINEGKFNQILDNLLYNSEYWLREERRKDASFTGEIVIELERGRLGIWDNGPGISLSVEENLFDPFVTTKSQGRGLGLYIVKQLLDAEGCSIELLPERNESGRCFKFEIDLGGVLND